MGYDFYADNKERDYLRELAKKYLHYSNLPIMEQRKKLWYRHNSLKGERPVIVVEHKTFQDDIIPPLKCKNTAAREIEWNLLFAIINHELIDDDKVISPYYTVYWKIDTVQSSLEVKRVYAKDSTGRLLGYTEQHTISDLKRDLSLMKPSVFSADREYTLAWKSFVEEVIGDILPVKIKNNSLYWYLSPSQKVVRLMGLENMMISIVDYPEEMHALYRFLVEDIMAFVKWQEREGILEFNNENDYAGAGSYGFSNELPSKNYSEVGTVTPKDLWGNLNSQETIGISPAMFGEFIFPYYYEIARCFGLLYYGCCEPVHYIWKDYISKLPGLRKVSVSPWCDEEYMGSVLKDSNSIIYSRKPSPNFIGVGSTFDEEMFSAHIVKTLKAAKGCHLEFIFRDVYTISGDIHKPGRAVKIVRELIEKQW